MFRKLQGGIFWEHCKKTAKKVVVLGSLKQISRETFALRGIKSFEVYGNVDTIDVEAFTAAGNCKKVICHGTVKNIGAQAFYYPNKFENLSLSKNIASIGQSF